MKESIGLIETMGMIASIEAGDVMLKTSNVKLVNTELVKGGLVTVTITGDVSAVKTAVDSAVAAVNRLGENLLISSHVIPRPDKCIESLVSKEQVIEENFLEPKPEVETKGSLEESPEIVVEEIKVQENYSQEELKVLLEEKKVDLVREYLFNQTVSQLREMAKQNNNFIIERKQLYRTNKANLVEAMIDYFSNK